MLRLSHGGKRHAIFWRPLLQKERDVELRHGKRGKMVQTRSNGVSRYYHHDIPLLRCGPIVLESNESTWQC